jgi:hypothetical protein
MASSIASSARASLLNKVRPQHPLQEMGGELGFDETRLLHDRS